MKTFTLFCLVFLSITSQLHAQWQHIGPGGGMVFKVISANGILVCVTSGGIYRSTNNATTWEEQNNTLPDEVITAIVHKNKFYVHTQVGLYSSADAITWTYVSIGGIYLIYSNGTNMFGIAGGKIYVSQNDGVSFGVGAGAYSVGTNSVISAIGSTLYVTANILWSSINGGLSWQATTNSPAGVIDMKQNTYGFLLTTNAGIYRHTGASYVLSNTGIPAGHATTKLLSINGKFYVTVVNGNSNTSSLFPKLYSSTDGVAWVLDNGNHPAATLFSIENINGTAYSCNSLGIFKSTDNCATWVKSVTGIKSQIITDLETGNNKLYTSVSNYSKGGQGGGLYSSADGGSTWQQLGIPDSTSVEKIIVKDNAIVALVTEDLPLLPPSNALYKSLDEGLTWVKLSGFLNALYDIGYANNTLFITTTGPDRLRIDRSTDFGDTWQQVTSSGYPITSYPLEINTTIGTTIFANIRINVNAGGGVYKSTDNALSWVPVNNGINPNVNIVSATAVGNTLFAVYNGYGSALYRSTNMGTDWYPIISPLQSYQINDIQSANGTIVASASSTSYNVDSGYLYKSLDNGTTWNDISPGLPYIAMGKMKILNGKLFVAPTGVSLFTNAATLPVKFTSIGANRSFSGVQVTWKVATENNSVKYEVERSTEGRRFLVIGTVASKGAQLKANYEWADVHAPSGNLYYRIKSLELGEIKYTGIVKVSASKQSQAFIVAPNPVVNNAIQLQFINQPLGNYTIRLLNSRGQQLSHASINHAGGNGTQSIALQGGIIAGTYYLEITNAENIRITQTVTIGSN